MSTINLRRWMTRFAQPDRVWYAKRLSGNDTLANGSHQAGPYVSRDFLFSLFPSLNRPESKNPEVEFDSFIDSDSRSDDRRVRVVWYNNRLHGGTRNETRLTRFGGASSPLLNPENTGALAIFAFRQKADADSPECRIWICADPDEEELAEDLIGVVEPAHAVVWPPQRERMSDAATAAQDCWLQTHDIPPDWIDSFPTGKEILRMAVRLRPADRGLDPDVRLLKRRACEYDVFRSLEEAVELPGIRRGFEDIDTFVTCAQRILQRRKVRSGRSLELHARQIFREEGLRKGLDFDHGVESEAGRKPDFLFPSQAAYRDPSFPKTKLRMLAAKTTCKDRWRQVLKEADRVPTKHLLTLQEGVSVNQFKEMAECGVRLVVPESHVKRFAKEIRAELTTFGDFIEEVRNLARPSDSPARIARPAQHEDDDEIGR